MESIRILQDTYENLYALTAPIAALLEKEMKKIPSWKTECDWFLVEKTRRAEKPWAHFSELDLYYLLRLLNFKWRDLRKVSYSNFFSHQNRGFLFFLKTKIQSCRFAMSWRILNAWNTTPRLIMRGTSLSMTPRKLPAPR